MRKNNDYKELRQGDIIYVDLNPTKGHDSKSSQSKLHVWCCTDYYK